MNTSVPKKNIAEAASSMAQQTSTAGTRKGVMLLQSVSRMIVNVRRASSLQPQQRTPVVDVCKSKPRRKMEDRNTINQKLLDSLAKRTHFNRKELLSLHKIYRKLVAHSNVTSRALSNAANSTIVKPYSTIEGIDRNCFRELLHTTFDIIVEESMMDRIFIGWEKGHDLLPLRLEGFLLGLSIFLRGTLAEKIAYCFRVYDMNNDGYITKDESFALLRNSMIHQPSDDDPDENVKDLMDYINRKMDIDSDGKISFEDYSATVIKKPMLLEAFGQCLPTQFSVLSFLATLNEVAKS